MQWDSFLGYAVDGLLGAHGVFPVVFPTHLSMLFAFNKKPPERTGQSCHCSSCGAPHTFLPDLSFKWVKGLRKTSKGRVHGFFLCAFQAEGRHQAETGPETERQKQKQKQKC
jgi:hypothetical protein